MTDLEFKAGDKVKCYFYGDEVFTLVKDGSFLRLENKRELFWNDGKNQKSHTHPALTLVERPKVKTQTQLSGYMKMYHGLLYDTEAEAEASTTVCFVGCIKVNGR